MLGGKAVGVTYLFCVFSVQNMDEEKEMLLEYKLKKVVLLVLCQRHQILWLQFSCFLIVFELFLSVFGIISNEKEREDLAVLEAEHVAKRARQHEKNE